jgi:hypothetical protein
VGHDVSGVFFEKHTGGKFVNEEVQVKDVVVGLRVFGVSKELFVNLVDLVVHCEVLNLGAGQSHGSLVLVQVKQDLGGLANR